MQSKLSIELAAIRRNFEAVKAHVEALGGVGESDAATAAMDDVLEALDVLKAVHVCDVMSDLRNQSDAASDRVRREYGMPM